MLIAERLKRSSQLSLGWNAQHQQLPIAHDAAGDDFSSFSSWPRI